MERSDALDGTATSGEGADGDARVRMVRDQLVRRGITDQRVLDAIAAVPRERFVPVGVRTSAYEDRPLPIGCGQTISQPYVVALMLEVVGVGPDDRVLEVGTGSGYAAAVLDELAAAVWTVERHGDLVVEASEALRSSVHGGVHVRWGDGSLGWPEAAPFDVIIVAAAAEEVPPALVEQLADGGRLVAPIGPSDGPQELVLLRRSGATISEERLGPVQFVPLVPDRSTHEPVTRWIRNGDGSVAAPSAVDVVARHCEPFSSIAGADLDGLVDRASDASAVLIGASTWGTSEVQVLGSRIVRAFVDRLGCRTVVIDADAPDVEALDDWVRGVDPRPGRPAPFDVFPCWRWRNQEFAAFLEWVRHRNLAGAPDDAVRLVGLDVDATDRVRDGVLRALEADDPASAAAARLRFATSVPWGLPVTSAPPLEWRAPAADRAVAAGVAAAGARIVGRDVVAPDWPLDRTARTALAAGAELAVRSTATGGAGWWAIREQRAAIVLESILRQVETREHPGPVVVWSHVARVGDAASTDLALHGAQSLGQACRSELGDAAYLIGMGGGSGSVAAATAWGGHTEVLSLPEAGRNSVETLLADTQIPAGLLPLRPLRHGAVGAPLRSRRTQRVLGPVIDVVGGSTSTELVAELPSQFDEYVWIGATSAVVPIPVRGPQEGPDRFPGGRVE